MRLSLALVALAGLAACGRRDHSDVKLSFDSTAAAAAAHEPLGPGDERITSTDGAVILSLVGDSVRMQLSDSLRRSVQHSLDTAGKSGFAGMITRSVSGVVGNALGFVVRIPVRDIDEISANDGEIDISSKGGQSHFRTSGSNNRGGEHSRFAPADADRFVAAVKARKAALAR